MQDERINDEVSRKVELAWLLAFYGGMLTDKQRQVLTLHCEEDLSQQEIADQLSITRQGVFDTLAKAKKQLMGYEAKLGLVERHRTQTEAARACLEALGDIRPSAQDAPALMRARQALENMLAKN